MFLRTRGREGNVYGFLVEGEGEKVFRLLIHKRKREGVSMFLWERGRDGDLHGFYNGGRKKEKV